MLNSQSLLLELDKLKSIYRKSYISDESRNENSAEHSWHIAIALVVLKDFIPKEVNLDHSIKLALHHDICEIGAGDVCAYHTNDTKQINEKNYLLELKERFPSFGTETLLYWEEYENQSTIESRWVKVVDKLQPFIMNLACKGRTWQEQGITKSMVLEHNNFIKELSPTLFEWIEIEINKATELGWLQNA